MKKFPKMVRQGDVLIISVNALPKNATPRKRDRGRIVLAYGEVTTHAHAIERSDVVHYDAPNAEEAARQLLADAGFDVEVKPQNSVTFLDIPSGAELSHEEHGTIVLAAGPAVVLRQTEWTDEMEPRTVAD